MNTLPNHKTLLAAMCVLQEQKEAVYGVDWKRFGFVSSMFNIFRKFIRLRTMWYAGWQQSKDDSRLDTVIDLLNYLILSALLHAARTPRAFAVFLSGMDHAKTLLPEYFEPNERGFKRFCAEVLGPEREKHTEAPRELSIVVPEIIALGEKTIEAWLTRVAALAEQSCRSQEDVAAVAGRTAEHVVLPPAVEQWLEQLSRALGKTSRPGDGAGELAQREDDPYVRLRNIFDMIVLCEEAALRQAMDAPDEWQKFLVHYGTQ